MSAEIRKPEAPLEDGTIRLVPLSEDYVDDFDELGRDDEVARFTYVRVPFDREHAVAWIARYVEGWDNGSLAGFAVESLEDSSFAGFAGIVRFDAEAREAEIGYIVAPAKRGQGIAQRALELLARWAISELGALRVELRIDVENAPSAVVAERAGFRREGVLRSVHFKAGKRIDLAVYSLLAGELA